ncbi:MAG: hypothetical protein H8E98_01940 [Bacteroidetes bacterium]|nr:hypothetical protein [Bacteroidota bacterium]
MRLKDEASFVREIIYKCGKNIITHSIDGSYHFKRIEFRRRHSEAIAIIIHLKATNENVKFESSNIKLIGETNETLNDNN